MHRNLKNPPHNERNQKTPPIRPRSYQKGHKCIPKTYAIPTKNPPPTPRNHQEKRPSRAPPTRRRTHGRRRQTQPHSSKPAAKQQQNSTPTNPKQTTKHPQNTKTTTKTPQTDKPLIEGGGGQTRTPQTRRTPPNTHAPYTKPIYLTSSN